MIAQDSSMGMRYQAMARDAEGEVIKNENIQVKAKLFASTDRETVFYEELHDTKSNEFGLINLTIGEGQSLSGIYSEIPWDENQVWVEISIKREVDVDFYIVTSSELLSVPYAQFAFKAGELINNMSLQDVMDLDIGRNYTDDHLMPAAFQWNTLGNEWAMYGAPFAPKLGTTDYSPVSFITNGMERLKITEDGDIVMPGNLTVSGILTAENDVFLNLDEPGGGSTTIYGATTIGGSGMNTATFTGDVQIDKTLNVDGESTFNDRLLLTDNNADFVAKFENTNNSDGDGIEIKLGKVHGAWDGSDYLNVTNPGVEFFDGTAETIKGWVTGDAFEFTDVLTFIPAAYIAGTLCQLANTLVIDNINSGLNLPVVLGPYGFGPIDLGVAEIPEVEVVPQFTLIPQIPQLPCDGLPSFSMPNISVTNVSNSLTWDNQFLSFVDKDDRELGSVRAISVGNWIESYFDGVTFVKFIGNTVSLDPLDVAVSAVTEFSLLAESYNTIGVEYASGHGDYAEWLERRNHDEYISKGDIVGVKGGKISKDLTDAEQIMAVSEYPIMLGNVPPAGEEHLGNNLAFMGQIPVKIMGPANSGDYIVADFEVPGYGIAISPEDMTIEKMNLVVGRAWETKTSNGPNMVNTLIGVNNGDYFGVIKDLEIKITDSESRIKTIEAKVEEISNALNENR